MDRLVISSNLVIPTPERSEKGGICCAYARPECPVIVSVIPTNPVVIPTVTFVIPTVTIVIPTKGRNLLSSIAPRKPSPCEECKPQSAERMQPTACPERSRRGASRGDTK